MTYMRFHHVKHGGGGGCSVTDETLSGGAGQPGLRGGTELTKGPDVESGVVSRCGPDKRLLSCFGSEPVGVALLSGKQPVSPRACTRRVLISVQLSSAGLGRSEKPSFHRRYRCSGQASSRS